MLRYAKVSSRFGNFDLLDGYSWMVGIYAGGRYFECGGLSYTLSKLTSLLYVMNEIRCLLLERGREVSVIFFDIGRQGLNGDANDTFLSLAL